MRPSRCFAYVFASKHEVRRNNRKKRAIRMISFVNRLTIFAPFQPHLQTWKSPREFLFEFIFASLFKHFNLKSTVFWLKSKCKFEVRMYKVFSSRSVKGRGSLRVWLESWQVKVLSGRMLSRLSVERLGPFRPTLSTIVLFRGPSSHRGLSLNRQDRWQASPWRIVLNLRERRKKEVRFYAIYLMRNPKLVKTSLDNANKTSPPT